jgi:hypothetical protein
MRLKTLARTAAATAAAAFLYRRFLRQPILTWGAAADEAAARLPGDELLENADGVATRAITIDAPPSAVWPWIAQMGPSPRGVVLGAGVGLVFVTATVTAMADVSHEQAGLAGIMTTAHELGAAIGVAVLAAVATTNGNPVSDYGNGFLVAAAIAAGLAVVAAVALPVFRPEPGTHASMH